MSYPKIPDLNSIVSQITEYVRLKAEYGNQNLDSYLADLEQTLKGSLEQLKNLPEDSELAAREPNSLEEIHRLRPDGPRKLWVERCTIFGGSFNSKRYQWTIAQVKSILKDENYIGNSVHNRQSTVSFKNKKVVRKPESEWFRVENTHEAIITKEVFLQVQEQIAGRRRVCKNGQTQIFAGLIKCADCGWTLSYADNRQNKTPYGYYHCGKNGQGLGQCSMHYIRYDVLYGYVLSRLQYWSEQVHRDDEKLLQQLLNAGNKERSAVKKQRAVELKRATKRKAEVDGLFTKLYEDWSLGKITEYNFTMLSERFQTEQRELETKIRELQEALSSMEQTESDAEKWVELIKQYASPTELTTELLNTLIEKIVVHEAVKSPDGCRKQKVDIYYRFIGKID